MKWISRKYELINLSKVEKISIIDRKICFDTLDDRIEWWFDSGQEAEKFFSNLKNNILCVN